MKNYQIALLIVAFSTATFLFSCSKSSNGDLHDVQLCLNKATADSAMACVDKIASDTTPLAYSLRCSAIFISQGFGDAASFVDALDSIGGSSGCGGSCSSTVSALTSLKFTTADVTTAGGRLANNNAAAEAFNQCSKADAKIYTQIASLFKLGTLTSMIAYSAGATPGTPLTDNDIKNAIQDPALSAEVVGAIVTVTYDNTCLDTENASDSTKTYCAELKKAYDAGSTPADIGSCLIHKLENPAYNVPPCS